MMKLSEKIKQGILVDGKRFMIGELLMDITQLEEERARLLATVRAAKDVYSTGFVQMFHQADGGHFYLVPVDDMEEFRDKLDAVEDLL